MNKGVPRFDLWSVLLLLGASVAMQGCGSYPRPVHTYEYLINYERMTAQYDPQVSLVYLPDSGAFKRCRGIVVGEIGVGERWVEDRQRAAAFSTLLRCMLVQDLARLRKFDFVARDGSRATLGGASGPVYRIDGMITRFDMGSGWARYLGYFVFLQAGATDLQLAGRVTDAATGELIMEFVDRRRHLGNTSWGPGLCNLTNSEFVMKVTAKQMSECLARFIDSVGEGVDVRGVATAGPYAGRTSEETP